MMIQKANFRNDLNALRAVAVMAVILFHYNVPLFNGGFSGVDIFFVLSGYLITGIILRGLQTERFSFIDFIRKRGQRILPALIFLIFFLLIVCFFIYLPNDYLLLAENSTASLLFISNMMYAFDGNYFAPSANTNLLLHTWSLSVEWQFYLLLPLFLVLINKVLKNDRIKYLILFTIAALLSFALSLVLTEKFPTYSFYLLPTRSWEILAGGIAFLLSPCLKDSTRKYLAIIGYIVLVGCILLLNAGLSWPGFFTLLPVLGTCMIIVSNWNNFKILKLQTVQFLGKISYSLYLWHWPLFVLSNYFGIKQTPVTITFLIFASVGFGYISYRFIESIKFTKARTIAISSFSFAIILGILSFKDSNAFLFKEKTLAISNYDKVFEEERKWQFGTGNCYITTVDKGFSNYNQNLCLALEKGKRNILLIGDSHAAEFSQTLREKLQKSGAHLLQATASGCLPVLKKNGRSNCNEIISFIYKDYLPKNSTKIDGIIISANWKMSRQNKHELLEDIKETLQYLRKLKIRTYILGQTETYAIPFSTIAARENEYDLNLSDLYLETDTEILNDFLKNNLIENYINIFNLKTIPNVSSNNAPYMFDRNHLTKYGADHVISQVISGKNLFKFVNH